MLRYEIDGKKLTVFYSETPIVNGTTDENVTIQVILWLRTHLPNSPGLAEAKAMVDKLNIPYTYKLKTMEELEAEELERSKALASVKPLTREQIESLIGDEDMCECGHKGAIHNDFGSCIAYGCICQQFRQEPELVN